MSFQHYITCALFGVVVLPGLQAAESIGSIVDTAGDHADVVVDGKPVLRYMYKFDEADKFNTAKVYLHVMAPDGQSTLTKGTGDKFPHHRGLFIGWSKIKYNGKGYDIWHVKNTDQKHVAFVPAEPTATATPIVAEIAWRDSMGAIILNETRTYALRHDDKDAYAVIDFSSTLKPVEYNIELNGDPEHAGIQYRPHEAVVKNKSAKYTFPETLEGEKAVKAAKDLPWVAETYQLNGATWTVQFMNHPDNPKNTRISAYRNYGRFGFFPVIPIEKDSSATVKYRIRISAGEAPSVDVLNKSYATYAEH